MSSPDLTPATGITNVEGSESGTGPGASAGGGCFFARSCASVVARHDTSNARHDAGSAGVPVATETEECACLLCCVCVCVCARACVSE
jgi:hypothetical protein